ncbi:MAG: hypothetical protein HF962_06030 [Sulfurovum sp.]|nr:hypothetical protein [Sulfurovum sp.]
MDFKNVNIEQLREKISELEESLSELKVQLKKQEEVAQHEAIDNLEEYLHQVDNKYETLRDLWPMVVAELKELMSKIPSKK